MFDRYNTVDVEDAKQAINQFRSYLLESVDQNVDQLPDEKEKEASQNLPTS